MSNSTLYVFRLSDIGTKIVKHRIRNIWLKIHTFRPFQRIDDIGKRICRIKRKADRMVAKNRN